MKIAAPLRKMDGRSEDERMKAIEQPYAMKAIHGKNLKSVSAAEDLCESNRRSSYSFRNFSS